MKNRVWMSLIGVAAALVGGQVQGAVGRTQGQFQVSSVGSAQYSIPIQVARGPGGLQPAISLVYDSNSSIGPLGVGWSIGGLGAITRCNKTLAQDGVAAPVALATSDGYCINGNRLRLTSGSYGMGGSVYQTEIADFSQITAEGTRGNGPDYFMVQGRNGLTYYYGLDSTYGANSQVLAPGSSPETVVTWLLSGVSDRTGNNTYVINYTTLNGALVGTAVPSVIYWTRASAGGSSFDFSMTFNYNTNVPQSSVNGYVAGTSLYNPALLSSIEIQSGSTVVKDYFVSYTASPVTGREEIASIIECPNTTNSPSNCLSPTTVTYGGSTAGVSGSATTALTSSGTNLTARYDLNGDGIPDLVYYNGGHWYVSFGSSSGYQTPVNTGITAAPGAVLLGNLNAGAKDGILANNGGTWYYYMWNGSAFTGTSTGLAYDSTVSQYQLADINNDGLPDLISLYIGGSTATVATRLNSTSGSAVSFSSTKTTAYTYTTSSTLVSAQLQTPDSQFSKLRRYDFNGDGLDDLALSVVVNTSGSDTTSLYELITSGTTFTPMLIASVAGNQPSPAFFTNWNDDACTDYVYGSTLYISGCNGTVPTTVSLAGKVVAAMDWDGDGRTDLLVDSGTDLEVELSTGGTTPNLVSTTLAYNSACQYVAMDSTGDGLDDLGCWNTSGAVTYYLHNGIPDLLASITDGFGNSASPTYVSIANSHYTQYSDAVYPYANYIGPIYVVDQVVFSDPSKTSGTWSESLTYAGAQMNLQGRGFAGFEVMQTYDSRTTLWDTKGYDLTFPYTGMLESHVLSQNSTNTEPVSSFSATLQSITLSSTQNNERYFPYLYSGTQERYELGGTENGDLITTTYTSYSYDNYGNATNISKTITDNDPNSPYTGQSWTVSTTNTTDISQNQSADLAQWCLNMLDETQVIYSSTVSGSSSVTRTKTFTPDSPANCRIKSTVTEPTANSGLYKVTEAFTFDSFGNIATDTVTGATMPSSPASRETQSNWGTTGQYLLSRTDPSNATSNWTYTSAQALAFGLPDSMKDPNNLTTSWSYDGFGRKTKEIRPDGTSTGWAWSLCTSYCGWSNSVYQSTRTAYQTNGTTVIRTDTTSYDPIDRATQVSGPTVTGTASTVQSLYDSLGRLSQKSMPFLTGGSVYQTTYTYDVLNRPLSVTRPVSASNSNPQSNTYAYAGRKTLMSDPYRTFKTTITDVNGWLRKTTDAMGYSVTKAYDSAGSLIRVTDSVGNTLRSNTYAYGLKAFLLSSTDADLGAWSFTVDSLGERTGWTDAKGQSFSMTYDALSRHLTRTEPDLYTQWTYGSTPASYNVGQLIADCTGSDGACSSSGGYAQSRTFDSAGRLSTVSITEGGNPGNDGSGVFLYTYGYSATTGLPASLTYPKSTSSFALNLAYAYNYGLLQSVTDTTDTTSTCGSTCVLWTENAANARGQLTQETLGNGVVTNRSYDAVTSWLSTVTAGVGGGSALLNQSYLQDEIGNVTQRQNNNEGLTESFYYDPDYRLTCATLAGSCSNATFVYDGGSGAAGPGNITGQTQMGTYSYPAAGQPRPHAVTSIAGGFNGIENPTFSYDANGNMTARAGSTITWSSYNYPLSISASDATGSEEVQFNYGPDRQRWEQIYTGPSGTEQTYYVGEKLEAVFTGTTNYRHYIYAGSEPVAVYSRTSAGVNTMSYFMEDHQGGVSAIASNVGVADVDENFSAFGTRRNPATWSGAPTTSDLNTIAGLSRQGYTFQTWLGQSMGLNHMNGRVQDAILGRMISADPHIPDSTSAQSYNRYSYANNNPLTYSDPTGFLAELCDGGCGGDGDDGFGIYSDDSSDNFSAASSGDLLPDVGCGIPPFGPCHAVPPPPPPNTNPFLYTPPMRWIGSDLMDCVSKSVVFCQKAPPPPPPKACVPSRANNPNVQGNIQNGAKLGAIAGTGIGAVVVGNVIGFPEVEVGEGGFVIFAALEGPHVIGFGGLLSAGIFGTVGGAGGYLSTAPKCP